MKPILILICFLLSACGSIRINGVEVRNTHKKYVRKSDMALVVGAVIVGAYIGKNVNQIKK